MNGTIPFFAAALSLFLTFLYGGLRYQWSLKAELHVARRIKTLAGLKTARVYSVEKVLRGILETLVAAYDSPKGSLEFHSKLYGDFSLESKSESKSGRLLKKNLVGRFLGNFVRPNTPEENKRSLAFIIDDESYSCCVDVSTGQVIPQNEYLYMQELIKGKISRLLLDKVHHATAFALTDVDSPAAVLDERGNVIIRNNSFTTAFPGQVLPEIAKLISNFSGSEIESSTFSLKKSRRKITIRKVDNNLFSVFSRRNDKSSGYVRSREHLLKEALESVSLGMVELEPIQNDGKSEFKIISMNKAFLRIFGLESSNSQSEEIDEILSVAIRTSGAASTVDGGSSDGTEISYMRHDGIKVRSRVNIRKGQSIILIFEPLQNTGSLISSYRQLLKAATELFATGNLRVYLTQVREATRSDGIAVMKKDPTNLRFDMVERVGFMIDVPQSLFKDVTIRRIVNSSGCIVVPTLNHGIIYGSLLALKPHDEAIEIIPLAAKVLETFETVQRDKRDMNLREEKLRADLGKAEAANNLKSQFLANMSHEIRTPLNSIIGFAEILHEEHATLSEELFDDFSTNIVSAGRHLLNLINDILDMTKVETGKMKLVPEEFSIKDIIESTKRTLTPVLRHRAVRLELEIDNNLDILNADPVKFKQILYNLLSNAIKFSPNGNVVKLVATRSGNGLEMKIIDKGVGIRKEDLGRLFKPFAQLDAKHDGTGLGLALTKKLVELHGGSIWIDSTYGEGTTVVVYLPLVCRQSAGEAKEVEQLEQSEEELLFLTEDDHLFELFNAIVEGTGFKVARLEREALRNEDEVIGRDKILIIDSAVEHFDGNVLSVCERAKRILLLSSSESMQSLPETLKPCEGKTIAIDRRNFTKGSVLSELNTAGGM